MKSSPIGRPSPSVQPTPVLRQISNRQNAAASAIHTCATLRSSASSFSTGRVNGWRIGGPDALGKREAAMMPG